MPEEHRAASVLRQEGDPASPLQRFRAFLEWRHAQPELIRGDIALLDTAEPVLAFDRRLDGRTLRCWFNTSNAPVALDAGGFDGRVLGGHGLVEGRFANGRIELPAFGVLFASR